MITDSTSHGVPGPVGRQVAIRGITVQDIGFAATVRLLADWALAHSGGYVCTPNVDHVVKAASHPDFRAALLGARLRVPDGMGIVYGSWIVGRPIRRTVTGRRLPEAVGAAIRGTTASLALFGGPPGVAEAAGTALQAQGVVVVQAFGPRMGFVIGSEEDRTAVERLRAADPSIVFVGLGAPLQELWMARHAPDLPRSVLVGVGAAIDVLGGRVGVAPAWLTRLGLEWAYRLAHEPRRLARRYLWDDPRFFWWMLRDRFRARSATPSSR